MGALFEFRQVYWLG